MGREQIKAGNVVQLKSGGERMTAEDPHDGNDDRLWVHCYWFEGKTRREADFPLSALKLADDDEPLAPNFA